MLVFDVRLRINIYKYVLGHVPFDLRFVRMYRLSACNSEDIQMRYFGIVKFPFEPLICLACKLDLVMKFGDFIR